MKRTVVKAADQKILGQLLKNFQTPILLTVPTGPAREREGWRGNTHERDGGFDRIGNRCNKGEGLRWLMHQCKH